MDFARVCTDGEKGVIVTPGALFEVLGDSLVTIKGNSDRQALRRLGEGGESVFDVSAETSSVKKNKLARVRSNRMMRDCGVRL